MKIAVINGNPVKGVTYMMKEEFLHHLREGNGVTEFYPKDLPPFCLGCKSCFLRGEENCPHSGAGMMGDIFADTMTQKHRQMLADKMRRLAHKVSVVKPRRHMSPKVRILFSMAKLQHKMVLQSESEPDLDNAHYIKHGWIKR